MNLQKAVLNLIAAQNSHDSQAYIDCFTETAIVYDEGQTHKGKVAIQQWIEKSNQEYNTVWKPLAYEKSNSDHLLTAEVSGSFPGSPAILQFYVGFEGGLIGSLKIT